MIEVTQVDSFLLQIACTTAGDARKWMEAFDHAKQVV